MSISELYRATGSIPLSGPSKSEAVNGNTKISGKEKLTGTSDFQKLLQSEAVKINAEPVKTQTLKLSSHAETRIKSREIPWSAELETRVNRGIDQAQSKGSREALILAGDVAFIANVKSRTVVTAMDRNQMKDRIFTNIDSAVLV